MKWVTFENPDRDSATDRVGLVVEEKIYAAPAGVDLVSLLGDDGSRLAASGEEALRDPAGVFDLANVVLRSPIPKPSTLRDFTSFEAHMATGMAAQGFSLSDEWSDSPSFWFANVNAVVGSGADVVIPGHTEEMDYELEFGAVIGRTGINLSPSEAEAYIAGFCIWNDWSARDLQRAEMRRMPIGPAKGKDFATSLGPMLVTPDELEHRRSGRGYDLTMTATVNGREYSRGNLDTISWSFAEMISFASRHCYLYPGDVIASGTVGTGCILELRSNRNPEEYPWLEAGDEVVLEVELLGSLRNRIVRGPQPIPLR